jgi:hypothetical protein
MRSVLLLGLMVATALSACELPFGRAPAPRFAQVCVDDTYAVCCRDSDGRVLSGACSSSFDALAFN